MLAPKYLKALVWQCKVVVANLSQRRMHLVWLKILLLCYTASSVVPKQVSITLDPTYQKYAKASAPKVTEDWSPVILIWLIVVFNCTEMGT